ncbi:hypothetical protein D9M71_678980 [compost metagenome]
MVDALVVVVGPGIAVGVEVDQRQRAMLACMGLEQWVGDEVVAAQGQHGAASRQNMLGMGLDHLRRGLGRTVVEVTIAIVDYRQMIEGVELPWPVPLPGRLHRGVANASWPKACTGPVAGGGVERHTADHHVDTLQVTAVTPAGKTGDTCVSAFCRGAVKAAAGHCLVVLLYLIHEWIPY